MNQVSGDKITVIFQTEIVILEIIHFTNHFVHYFICFKTHSHYTRLHIHVHLMSWQGDGRIALRSAEAEGS